MSEEVRELEERVDDLLYQLIVERDMSQERLRIILYRAAMAGAVDEVLRDIASRRYGGC